MKSPPEPLVLGTFGDITIQDECVLKSLKDNDSLPYFIREVAALKLLQDAHVPGIVQMHGVLDNATIKLEKFDGDLLDYLPKTYDDVYRVTYQLLLVMCNLAQLNISHRDIKPENILTTEDTVKIALCDFGLARYFSESQIPDQCTGSVQTSLYRAPEIHFKNNEFDPKNMDIWSLGVTVLELLGLEDMLPPYLNTVPDIQALERVYQERYGTDSFDDEFVIDALESGIDPDFLSIIKSMLTIDYKTRPDAMTLLSDSFFDDYRHGADVIDGTLFNQNRINEYRSLVSKTGSLLSTDHLTTISYSDNISNDTRCLSVLLYCKLYDSDPARELDVEHIIALMDIASAVCDSEIPHMNMPVALELLKDLNYDLFLPIRDLELCLEVNNLLSTV